VPNETVTAASTSQRTLLCKPGKAGLQSLEMSGPRDMESDDMNINRQLLFETFRNAQSEEEYAEMVLSELGDPDFDSQGSGAGAHYDEDHHQAAPPAAPAPVPSYMHPTLASVLPPYLQGEVERVQNSYRTGSYNSIKKLPATLQPGQIRETRKHQITENLLLNSNTVFKPSSNRNEPFQRPEYIGTDYDKMKNLHKYWYVG
jgi:hypothetical protein